jgi:hypothetical protein
MHLVFPRVFIKGDTILIADVQKDATAKEGKRVDAVGIEPTTFHMCVDAKRLIRC